MLYKCSQIYVFQTMTTLHSYLYYTVFRPSWGFFVANEEYRSKLRRVGAGELNSAPGFKKTKSWSWPKRLGFHNAVFFVVRSSWQRKCFMHHQRIDGQLFQTCQESKHSTLLTQYLIRLYCIGKRWCAIYSIEFTRTYLHYRRPSLQWMSWHVCGSGPFWTGSRYCFSKPPDPTKHSYS